MKEVKLLVTLTLESEDGTVFQEDINRYIDHVGSSIHGIMEEEGFVDTKGVNLTDFRVEEHRNP